VTILSGKDKNKQGKVLKVYRKSNRIMVSGLNLKFKRYPANIDKEEKSGIRTISHSIHVSKAALIDPES